MFHKRLTELTPDDITALVERRTPEDEELELKRTLATRDGGDDRWLTSGDEIGSNAKKDVAKELIAFANTSGGTLIIGVSEDGEGRAQSLHLMPKCRALAERLAASVAASADPRLDSVVSAGIEFDGQSGIVVLQLPPSPRAPHRDRDARECYYRNGQRSEPMDMHRIQLLSVERWRGLQQIEQRLHSRPFEFDRQFVREFFFPDGPGRTRKDKVALWVGGCRATAVPLGRVLERNIARRDDLKLTDAPLYLIRGNGKRELWNSPNALTWRPILRGIVQREIGGDWAQREERTILSDGLIEVKATSSEYFQAEDGESSRELPVNRLLQPLAQFLVMAESFRTIIGRPNLEFAVSIEWRVPTSAKVTIPSRNGFSSERPMKISEEINTLSDLELPMRSDLPDFWSELQRDFFHSFGRLYENLFPLDFEASIEEVLKRAGTLK